MIIGHTNHGILTCPILIRTMTFGDSDFPFGLCDLAELKGINSEVFPHELPNNNIVNEKNDISNLNNNSYRFSNLCDKVIDENIVNLTNCKYYSISQI